MREVIQADNALYLRTLNVQQLTSFTRPADLLTPYCDGLRAIDKSGTSAEFVNAYAANIAAWESVRSEFAKLPEAQAINRIIKNALLATGREVERA